ncbi:MAG TPA: bacillithiol biosynthesis deacetylase BshB1 [Bacillota bacterium]|nr:bacillithiol biosynthesis deacetylase BshB1 [Bacillota bacterium]
MAIDILAIGAHPDDIEIGAAGSIIKHVSQGKRITLCDLTYAELSSNGDVTTRQKEALLAAERMGNLTRINLGMADRHIECSEQNIRSLVEVIRKEQPKMILAPYWQDRHPDHVHCSELVQEAAFSAGIRKYAPDTGNAHKVSSIYFYFINDFVEPDFCIDISDHYDQKIEALKAYESQFLPSVGGVETPLNTGYFETVRSREYLFGRKIGAVYAEGFKSRTPISIETFC